MFQGVFEFIKCKIQKNIHSSAQNPAEVSNIDSSFAQELALRRTRHVNNT